MPGPAGAGPLEHVALPIEPDLVVIQLFLGNDVAAAAPDQVTSTRWYDADSYLAVVLWYRLQILREAEFIALADIEDEFDPTHEDLQVKYPWLADPFLEEPSMSGEVYSHLMHRRAWAITLPHADVHERFFAALEKLERAAGEVPLAFVLIPDEFQVEDDLWEEIVSKSEKSRDRDLSQRRVLEWLNSRGRAVLDLLPILRSVEPLEDGRRHLYHLRDTHFNARGNEIAGGALGGFVQQLLSDRGAVTAAESPPASLPLYLLGHLGVGDSGARRFMLSGWALNVGGSRPFVWSQGLRSVLRVPLPKGGDIRMDIEASPFVFPDAPQQHVSVFLNGTIVDVLPLRPGLHVYSVVLPAELLVDSPSIVEFHYAYARAPVDVLPNSPDTRKLGVAWRSFEFAELDP